MKSSNPRLLRPLALEGRPADSLPTMVSWVRTQRWPQGSGFETSHTCTQCSPPCLYIFTPQEVCVGLCAYMCVFYIYRWFTGNLDIQKYIKYIESKSFLGGSALKNLPMIQKPQETGVWSLGQDDPLEEGMAICSNILAWRIPWTEETGGLLFLGLHRVGHDWSDWAHIHMGSK